MNRYERIYVVLCLIIGSLLGGHFAFSHGFWGLILGFFGGAGFMLILLGTISFVGGLFHDKQKYNMRKRGQ